MIFYLIRGEGREGSGPWQNSYSLLPARAGGYFLKELQHMETPLQN